MARTAPAVRLCCLLALAACSACSGSTTAPSPSPSTTITFSGISTGREPVTLYSEAGFAVSINRGDWITFTDYGNPKPFIEFFSTAGTSTVGEVAVFGAAHAPFRFRSVDLYSSVTPIPYSITGYRNDAAVFTLSDRLPNTFGNFRTVTNTSSDAAIDTLIISLTNPAVATANPMGIDNIALVQ